MTRRKFAFWIGLGLFGLAEKMRVSGFDKLAASIMCSTQEIPLERPEHWVATDDETCQWYERESWIDDQWTCTGKTIPIDKQTGKPCVGTTDCIDDRLVPQEVRSDKGHLDIKSEKKVSVEPGQGQPDPTRRARHGRPPSKWLRSLEAEELRIWLKTIEVPNAGVCGMTFWTHLTRDHSFTPAKIEGLTKTEQEKLHSAAHYGY